MRVAEGGWVMFVRVVKGARMIFMRLEIIDGWHS